MLNKISLERFRGFRSVEVELAQSTVLIGPNSSGKTTVLHAARMASTALGMALDSDQGVKSLRNLPEKLEVCWGMVVADHKELVPVSTWEALFVGSETGENTALVVKLEFDSSDPIQTLEVELKCARNQQVKLSVWVIAPRALEELAGIPARSKRRALKQFLRDHCPTMVMVPAFYGVVGLEEYRTSAIVERLLGSGDQAHIVRNLVVRLSSRSLERLNTLLLRTVGARIENRTSQGEVEDTRFLQVRFCDSNGPLELTAAGAGLINLIALYASLERVRDRRRPDTHVIFLLDEPEAHLHPRLQGEVGAALVELAGEFGAQLIIATHAVEIINTLGTRSDVVLTRIDRQQNQATVLTSQTEILRDLEVWCDLTPFSAVNFLASKRLLFHEGPSDREILRSCAAVLYRNDDDRRRRFEDWTLVSLGGVGNLTPSKLIRSLLRPELFPNLDANDPVRLFWVIDRDHVRTPGWEVLDTEEPRSSAAQLVWSAHSIESLFLRSPTLEAWLTPTLQPTDPAEFRHIVESALDSADQDEELLAMAIEQASAQKMQQLMRDGSASEANIKRAIREVSTAVKAEPQIWQPGRARAKLVLSAVRDKLDPKSASKVPGSIEKLLKQAPTDLLGRLEALIPHEIRELLDRMTER
ncbi:MAG TPA: hypothetical protein ENK57_00060 [Polyangiaceae bacterium]|nr:hypothetical protein [Polyangiaceae bacterium]